MSYICAFIATLVPTAAFAQMPVDTPSNENVSNALLGISIFIILSVVFSFTWHGIMNVFSAEEEPIKEVEQKKKAPYIPSFWTMVTTVICSIGMFLLSLKTMSGVAPFHGENAMQDAALFFLVLAIISIAAQYLWPSARHYVFAVTVGTVATFILMGFHKMLFYASGSQDPFMMALGIICIVVMWKFLFGPWRPEVKATVLATFIFWLAVRMLFNDSPDARLARILATAVAFVPAVIWCMLFLKEHTQRMSLVVLMFLAGMLSTAPILFYDSMVRHKLELQFFLFRIVPENFTSSSSAFVSGNLTGFTGVNSTIAVTLVSFLIVGLIEEFSKFWVLKRSGEKFFSSIDDVIQLGIIVAIGFAFAENVMNPTYFMAFVQNYLINPSSPDWGAFMGNILGRAVLTNMVHILSTGVCAYFYGLSLFANPYMEEEVKDGHFFPIAEILNRTLRLPKLQVFRQRVFLEGFTLAVILHGLFNFLVTLPDLLPGQPRTIGDIFGAPPDSFLHMIALLVLPSLFYVVGGFWILSVLFYKKECMKERGCVVRTEQCVKVTPALA